MKTKVDLAIIGSGFAGSLLAMIARRQGRSVALIERTRHPRFAIGESSTPITNLLLEDLATRYDLPRLLPLTKWGTWQKMYPEIACGLKRGFTFYHHQFGEPFTPRPDRSNELLVAASPNDTIADTHWYRPDFDAFMVREAQSLGVDYSDETILTGADFDDTGATLSGQRLGQPFSLRARFVIDATGPRGFLHRTLGLLEVPLQQLPATQALYAHFTGVRRMDDLVSWPEIPPYPVDDAALHHVFDGGWVWVLRFNNGITSAGVAVTNALALELNLADGAPAWERLLERLPTLRRQFASARPVSPFVYAPQPGFRSGEIAGRRWALLPSAAGFVDPLLSTGFPVTLLGLERLARILENDWDAPGFADHLDDYARRTRRDLDSAEQHVAALYASMRDLKTFTAVSMLYFAAASYSETARRLAKPELTGSAFLLADHREFGSAAQACAAAAIALGTHSDPIHRRQLLEQIESTLSPVNIAGLHQPEKRHWYPVDPRDLLANREKLQASAEEIERLLERCGFGIRT
ncbi:MAG: FAD-dependent oxidoreductase [Opitutaceae bacterium]|nr:FAD-dependent oxidoreductase [Verrucomicrobiales bacterium]